MPPDIYTVEIDGTEYDLEGDHPPTEAEARAAVGKTSKPTDAKVMVGGQPMSIEDYNTTQQTAPQPPARPTAGDAFLRGALPGMPPEVAKGIAKGGLRTVVGMGKAIRRPINALTGAPPLVSDAALGQIDERLQYRNPQQRVGGALETAAELAVPIKAGLNAVPRTARAAQKFEAVMGAAKNVPVDVGEAGNVALRTQELAERGGTMPRAVRQFMNRVTDPDKPPMTYAEARDFASNISRLSADDYNRLTPVIKRQVTALRVALNEANAKAATQAGKGPEYGEAMKEFAQASKLRGTMSAVGEGMKKGLPYAGAGAIGAGVAYWTRDRLKELLGGGE